MWRPRFLSFRTRIVVLFLGLLALVQGTVLVVIDLAGRQAARARLSEELAVGAKVFDRLLAARTDQLAEAARLLSGDFGFKAAATSGDHPTVLSALNNHRVRIGADRMMLATLDGRLQADTVQPELRVAPFPFPELLETAEEAGQAVSIVVIDERAYQLVAVPLLAPLPVAWIAVGFQIDDRMAQELRDLTLLEVSFLQAGADGRRRLLASTLSPQSRQEAMASAPAAGSSASLITAGEEHVALAVPLGEASEAPVIAVLQRSLADVLAPLRRTQLLLLGVTAGGLLVSGVAAVFIARRVTRPVLELVGGARRVEDGEYGHPIRLEQRDELGELAATFNRMMAGLAERDRVRAELERLSRLRRFFSPQLAEAIVSSGDEAVLTSHRREITVVFCDLRGFTAFAETAAPEELMGLLREYHEALGRLIFEFEGTLERFTGDGLMIFFNDPLPCPDPAARAVRLADAMRRRAAELGDGWRRRGHDLGFGVGVAMGYATLGRIGFEGRVDYAAIGSVTNLSARLCAEAGNGQILITQRVLTEVEDLVEAEPLGDLTLKGFQRPVPVFNVRGLKVERTGMPAPARTG